MNLFEQLDLFRLPPVAPPPKTRHLLLGGQLVPYVLRQGRLTSGQQRAFDELWPRYGVEFRDAPIDLAVLFGNDHPVTLAIGFGNGDSLAAIAEAELSYGSAGEGSSQSFGGTPCAGVRSI